jgi:hypothetical protein
LKFVRQQLYKVSSKQNDRWPTQVQWAEPLVFTIRKSLSEILILFAKCRVLPLVEPAATFVTHVKSDHIMLPLIVAHWNALWSRRGLLNKSRILFRKSIATPYIFIRQPSINWHYLTLCTFPLEIKESSLSDTGCRIQDVVSPHCGDKGMARRCTISSLTYNRNCAGKHINVI